MPLAPHLRPTPAGSPDPSSVLTGPGWRIQVLTERLVRIEWSPGGTFEDRPTQVVSRRDFPALPQPPQVERHRRGDGEEIRVSTPYLTLTYDGGDFSPQGLCVQARRGAQWGGSWRWGVTEEGTDLHFRNLGGTARTLDTVDGRIALEPGIMDGRGVASLVDDTPAITEEGWVELREAGSRDVYLFVHGHDFRGAIRDFYRLTGPQPVIPRFALGNWWSRYHPYSAGEYLELLDTFDAHRVPLAVAVLDMDWHLVDLPEQEGSGWTGFTWNRDLFPDPEGFARTLHGRGLALTLNLHPADGVRSFEDCYERIARRMGIDPVGGAAVPFDPADPELVAAYLEEVLHPLEEDGVDFWWIDWQQGSVSRTPGLDPLWILNHVHVLDSAHRHGGRGLTLSRYAGPGSHRYPVGFSGDTVVSWASLDFQPEFTATASNIGYGWWSHDIGGHMFGTNDHELATRWVQFGVFSPVNRLHSTLGEFSRKEPWLLPVGERTVQEHFLRLRHRLVPYLHTEQLWGHEALQPLVQPMYWEDPNAAGAWAVPDQYMFGRSLSVAPVTTPVDGATGCAQVPVWLPEGRWVDLFTGMAYRGGRRLVLNRPLEILPVLAREGAVVPLAGIDGEEPAAPTTDNPAEVEVLVVAGASGEYTLVEDDDHEGGARAETRLTWDQTAQTLTIHPVRGDAGVVPDQRTWRVRVLGTAHARLAGPAPEGVTSSWDADRGALVVDLCPGPVHDGRQVRFTGAEAGEGVTRDERVHRILARAEVPNPLREGLWEDLRGADRGGALGALFAREAPQALRSALAEVFAAAGR